MDSQGVDNDKYNRRLGTLENERSSWMSHWQELTTYLLPRNGRYFTQDRNRGERTFNSIYDSTGTRALRTLGAGLMSGATSPARPWFRIATPDPAMMKLGPVKVWTNSVTNIILDVFAKSNTYRALHTCYEELGAFGTAAMIMQDDFDDVINLASLTVGEYYLGKNAKDEVDTIYRKFQMQVGGMADPKRGFGLDKCSDTVNQLYKEGNMDAWIDVVHVIEPRYVRDPSLIDSKNMPWKSIYYERDEKVKILRESGYTYFPGLCPRWNVAGGDIYGNSPGMEALGDVKQLQHEQVRKGQVIDYQTKPPLQLPTAMKGREHETLPGGVAYFDQSTPNAGIRSMFDVQLNLSYLLQDIQDVRGRINGAFYADLFLMLSQQNETSMTATEVSERHEEKLTVLGPVIERLHNELLSPLVENTFNRCLKAGILPPPPPELQGMQLNVEMISVLAQAQRAVGTNGIDRFTGQIIAISQVKPEVLDKFDSDAWADIYSDNLGVDPSLVVPDDKVQAVRSARAKAQAQQQQAALQESGSKTAKNLAAVPPSSDIMAGLTGYSTPQSTGVSSGS